MTAASCTPPRTGPADGPDVGAPHPPAPGAVAELVLARVRLRADLRAQWLRTLWPEGQGSASQWSITHAEVDICLGDRDNPDDEASWIEHKADRAQRAELAVIEACLAQDTSSRLAHLCHVFGLGPTERDLIQLCLAAAVDPSLLRVYAYLQDNAARTFATDPLAARLFGHRQPLLIDPGSPLLRWAIIASTDCGPAEPPARTLDPAVRDWLLGSGALDPDLAEVARIQPVLPAISEWPVDETAAALDQWLACDPPTPVRVRLAGVLGSGRRTFAAVVAARLGLPLLAIDAPDPGTEQFARVYLKAQRQAFLDRCATAFAFGQPMVNQAPPEAPAHFPLQFVIAEAPSWSPPPRGVLDYLVELPAASLETRRKLWRAYAPWSANWSEPEREALISQHRSRPADLALIGQRGPSSPSGAAEILGTVARESLGDLARRLECPFRRDDLVLTATVQSALDDLLFEARDRAALWEQPAARRLFPQGRGLLALFCGSPGTGKTMSAQVIAAILGVDLFRIDLATVVSKWVGETSRNVDRLLRRAAAQDVVLLFDEADALFGKRTDIKEANDRFANTDTGYLLQAIESYEGIALLASNRKGDIDPAFMRRIRYVLDFPVPDAAERLKLWRTLVGKLAGADRADVLAPGLDQLATMVEVTGAQIKFAVLSGVFAARRAGAPVGLAHLLHGLERELGKEGRPLSERVRERVITHAS
jgi:ATPase family associated with various cellular activities (AAA)